MCFICQLDHARTITRNEEARGWGKGRNCPLYPLAEKADQSILQSSLRQNPHCDQRCLLSARGKRAKPSDLQVDSIVIIIVLVVITVT